MLSCHKTFLGNLTLFRRGISVKLDVVGLPSEVAKRITIKEQVREKV